MAVDSAVGRVALRVGDLDRLVSFYTDVVGLALIERTDDRASLGVGDTPLLELGHAPEASARDREAAGLFHTAVRVPDRRALGAALARIEADWQLDGASDHRVSEALYLRDPEDNGIEIYCDRPRAEWPTADGRVQMDTLALDLDALRAVAADGPRLPPPTDIGHVHLEVPALEPARAFYVDTLGFTLRQAVDGALFVAAGDYHHHVGLNVWNERSVAGTGRGLDWYELSVPGDLSAVRKRAEAAGVDVTSTPEGFRCRDPAGIEVRVTDAR
jgi:catechol 2,3-dioxygenase